MSTATTDNAQTPPRITKRKLDDAISLLDSAVHEKGYGDMNTDGTDGISPPNAKRRALTVKSIYASLSRYGFKSKDSPTEKNASLRTPRLTALLDKSKTTTSAASTSSSTSSTSQRPTISSPQALMSRPPYRPTSAPDFLARLSTFKLTTYRDKPRPTDAVYAARCGWKNDGIDRLVCESCSATWVVASVAGMSREAANTLTERQRAGMITSHKDACPWRTRQCDESIYRVPIKGSTAQAKEIRDTATIMTPVVKDVLIKHPLTTAQVAHLESTIASLPRPLSDSLDSSSSSSPPPNIKPSETALVLAVFGWSLCHSKSALSKSLTKKPSVIPPSLARSATVSSHHNHHRTSSGGGGPPRSPSSVSLSASTGSRPNRTQRPSSFDGGALGASLGSSSEDGSNVVLNSDAVISCSMCQRRVGVWGFSSSISPLLKSSRSASGSSGTTANSKTDSSANTAAQVHLQPKTLDVIREHRSYCPYIVKSTPLPSFSFTFTPSPASGTSTPVSQTQTYPQSILKESSSIPFSSKGAEETLTEGWRAILSVVGRAGMGRRRRKRSDRFGMELQIARGAVAEVEEGESGATGNRAGDANGVPAGSAANGAVEDEDEGERNVDAMVDSVKRGGGKELLRYVKGLLG